MCPSNHTLRRQLRHAENTNDCVHLLKSLVRTRRRDRDALHPLALLTAAEMAEAS